jgi:hypothetical protein
MHGVEISRRNRLVQNAKKIPRLIMYARQKKLHTNPDAQNNIKGVQSGVMGVPLIYTIIFLYYRSLSYYGCKLQWDPQQHHLAKKLHYMAINDTRLSV